MLYTEKGTLYKIYPVESGTSANGQWANQRIVIQVPTNYNSFSYHALKVPQKYLNDVARLHVGDKVLVQFIIESREGRDDRWFTDCIMLHIQPEDEINTAAPAPAAPAAPAPNPRPAKYDGLYGQAQLRTPSPRAQFDENGDSADLPF